MQNQNVSGRSSIPRRGEKKIGLRLCVNNSEFKAEIVYILYQLTCDMTKMVTDYVLTQVMNRLYFY